MFDLTARICEYKDPATLPLVPVSQGVSFNTGGAAHQAARQPSAQLRFSAQLGEQRWIGL